jgi:UDP-N-acetylmuramoylalanine-D-glutamate ligase
MMELEDKEIQVIECVKGAFLVGETRKSIRAAWDPFNSCAAASSLLKTGAAAAKTATSGDVVLLSPACSSWDQLRDNQHRGEVICRAMKSMGRGVYRGTPNINGNNGDSRAVK